jgi:protein-tyrosine-phosphatase
MRRAFTIREFARLSAGVGAVAPASDRAVLVDTVGDVAGQRGHVDAIDPAEDEIGDPYGASLEVMRTCGTQIRDAVDGIARLLGVTAAA